MKNQVFIHFITNCRFFLSHRRVKHQSGAIENGASPTSSMNSYSNNVGEGENENIEVIDFYELMEVTDEFEVTISNQNTNSNISDTIQSIHKIENIINETSSQLVDCTEVNNFSTKYENSELLNKTSTTQGFDYEEANNFSTKYANSDLLNKTPTQGLDCNEAHNFSTKYENSKLLNKTSTTQGLDYEEANNFSTKYANSDLLNKTSTQGLDCNEAHNFSTKYENSKLLNQISIQGLDDEEANNFSTKYANSELLNKTSSQGLDYEEANNFSTKYENSDLMNLVKLNDEDCNESDLEGGDTSLCEEQSNRVIMDFDFVFDEIHRTFEGHLAKNKNCSYEDWKLVKNKNVQIGLMSRFCFRCNNCKYETYITSEPTNDVRYMDINTAAVAATIANGIGHTQLREILAGISVHCLSDRTYTRYQNLVKIEFNAVADRCMKEAAEEEKRLAIERGDVTSTGIPFTKVATDGSWGKRSFGTNYNSLSGAASIIGWYTGKILFFGVRNKYCVICARAENLGNPPKKHECYKNWNSNAPSTAMETDIILEGFKCSVETHGLIYETIITDGDSSVYKGLVDSNVYLEHNVVVKRVLCSVHLLRNLCKKLRVAAATTQGKSRRVKGFVQARNLIKTNINKIRERVEEVIDLRIKEAKPWEQKIDELRKDILNVPSHIFGEHKECKELGHVCNQGDVDNVKTLNFHNLYEKVMDAIEFLSRESESLLHKVSNNMAESFNSLIGHALGGKRIFFSQKSSYETRVAAKALQYNTHQALTELYKSMDKNVPAILHDVEKTRQIKLRLTQQRRREGKAKGKKRKHLRSRKNAEKFYGPNHQDADKSNQEIEKLRKIWMEKLKQNQNNRIQIEQETRDQNANRTWTALRKTLLTSYDFQTACTWNRSTNCAKRVKEILYPPLNDDNKAIMYGLEQEKIAKQKIAEERKLIIQSCGLFIDENHSCLGTTPDGIVDDDWILEIKSPYTAANMPAEKAIRNIPEVRRIFDKKNVEKINKKHKYYYQIQGQLHITRRKYCLFVIHTLLSRKYLRIDVDEKFWKEKMEKQLIRFYMDCMLPEILDSRHNRRMPIRNPQYTIELISEKKRKKQKMGKSIEKPVFDKSIEKAKENEKVNVEETISCIKRKTIDRLKIIAARKVIRNAHNQKNKQRTKLRNLIKAKQNIINKRQNETAVTADPDVLFVSHNKNYVYSERDIQCFIQYIDAREISMNLVIQNVQTLHSWLNDDSIDVFIRLLISSNSAFVIQSVLYINAISRTYVPTDSPSIQIMGGDYIKHWRCLYYDGTKIYIYDSLPTLTNYQIHEIEKQYIRRRFPNVTENNIVFPHMLVRQPDSSSCGVYAAAFAETLNSGGDPSQVRYSTDARQMRHHFLRIITQKQLSPFPRSN